MKRENFYLEVTPGGYTLNDSTFSFHFSREKWRITPQGDLPITTEQTDGYLCQVLCSAQYARPPSR